MLIDMVRLEGLVKHIVRFLVSVATFLWGVPRTKQNYPYIIQCTTDARGLPAVDKARTGSK